MLEGGIATLSNTTFGCFSFPQIFYYIIILYEQIVHRNYILEKTGISIMF